MAPSLWSTEQYRLFAGSRRDWISAEQSNQEELDEGSRRREHAVAQPHAWCFCSRPALAPSILFQRDNNQWLEH